ncbi:hypothetical protein sync_2419 [Synechococcus sp. CC9311]|nr:hypothetical protein sync_2419 [Synechococcus sp. CC9311]
MAQMYLVTLSKAIGNDLDAQKWMLGKACNRVRSLGKVSLTTMYSSREDLESLVLTFNLIISKILLIHQIVCNRLDQQQLIKLI